MALTNQAQNTASLTNQNYGEGMLTWDEATMTWNDANFTWDRYTTTATNQAANSASLSNQAKN